MSRDRLNVDLTEENRHYLDTVAKEYGAKKDLINFLIDRLRAICSRKENYERLASYILLAELVTDASIRVNVELSGENWAFVGQLPQGGNRKTINFLLDRAREASTKLDKDPKIGLKRFMVSDVAADFLIIPDRLRNQLEF